MHVAEVLGGSHVFGLGSLVPVDNVNRRVIFILNSALYCKSVLLPMLSDLCSTVDATQQARVLD